ncbi:MAG: hypothetical protein V3S17_03265 [candidate division Zixibacteria bacterium]
MRNRPYLKFCFLIFVLLFSASSARAFEFVTSRGLGVAGTLLLSEPSASTLLQLPTSGITQNEWIFEAGALREFQIKELDRAYLVAATRVGNFIVAAGIAQLGQRDFYAEKTLRTSLGYLHPHFGLSLNVSGVEYDFGGLYGSLRAAAVGAGFSFSMERLYLAASFDNLNSPTLLEGSPEMKPDYSFYGELKGKGAYSIMGRITFQKNEETSLALAQRKVVSDKGNFYWGISSAPFQIGGGMELKFVKRGIISYAGSFHPALGYSHNISLIYRLGASTKGKDGFE